MNAIDIPSFILWTVVFALAVYRVSHMVALEDGPLDAFAALRWHANKHLKDNWIARGLSCPLCISYWLSALAALYLMTRNTFDLVMFIVLWHAIASLCLILQRKLYLTR